MFHEKANVSYDLISPDHRPAIDRGTHTSQNLTAMVRFFRDELLKIMHLNECTLEFALDMMGRKLPLDLDQAYEAVRELSGLRTMTQDIDKSRIANATTEPEEHEGIEITEEMIEAGRRELISYDNRFDSPKAGVKLI